MLIQRPCYEKWCITTLGFCTLHQDIFLLLAPQSWGNDQCRRPSFHDKKTRKKEIRWSKTWCHTRTRPRAKLSSKVEMQAATIRYGHSHFILSQQTWQSKTPRHTSAHKSAGSHLMHQCITNVVAFFWDPSTGSGVRAMREIVNQEDEGGRRQVQSTPIQVTVVAWGRNAKWSSLTKLSAKLEKLLLKDCNSGEISILIRFWINSSRWKGQWREMGSIKCTQRAHPRKPEKSMYKTN